MSIIDFRFRPAFSNFLDGWLYNDLDRRRAGAKRWGSRVPEAVIQKSLELSVKDLEKMDTIGVVPGRKSFDNMDNGDLEKLMKQYPNRFICLAGVDPSQDIKISLNEIDQYVIQGNCTGINIEPGYCNPQLTVDDEKIYPIYEKCQSANIPILLAFGGLCYSSLRYMMPQMLDKVAEDFPDLKIVLAHGGFPWVHEMCWVALSKKNVYLAPDLYAMYGPGSQDYIAAANYLNSGKIVFASAYPVISLDDAVKYYRTCGIREECLPDVMYNTAAKILGLEQE